jgi:hypothetical protein
MHPGEFGVFIPIFGMMIAALAIWTSHKQKMIKLELELRSTRDTTLDGGAQDSRLEYLEERVQILERIVTDNGFGVAAQIEALRDCPQGRLVEARER